MPRKKKSKPGSPDPQREVLKEIYAVVNTPSNVSKARAYLDELLSSQHASLNQISRLSGIGYITLLNLKNQKSGRVSDKIFLQISDVYEKVKSGELTFLQTRKGRQRKASASGIAPSAKPAAKQAVVSSMSASPKKEESESALPPLQFTDPTVLVSTEEIRRKEGEIRRLNAELEYLKEVRALQERYKDILF